MLKHIVMWKQVGLNVEPSSAAFDVVLYSEFEDAVALQAYQAHPEHARVAELVGRVRAERVLVDYLVARGAQPAVSGAGPIGGEAARGSAS